MIQSWLGMIYLVRHGETQWNRQHRYQGHRDSPLTEKGVAQAVAIGRLLQSTLGVGPDVDIVSSPLGRAMRTAAIVCQELGLPEHVAISTPLLIEHDMGCWEALTPLEVDRLYPGQRKVRNTDKWSYVIPRGESYALLGERSRRWLDIVPRDRVVVAVTHEMISRTIRGAYAGLSVRDTLSTSHPQDCIYLLCDGKVEELRTTTSVDVAD